MSFGPLVNVMYHHLFSTLTMILFYILISQNILEEIYLQSEL